MFRAMALSGLGYRDQARAEAARAREIRPEVMDDPGAHLGDVFLLTDEERTRLVSLLLDTDDAVPAQRQAADGADGAVPGVVEPLHA